MVSCYLKKSVNFTDSMQHSVHVAGVLQDPNAAMWAVRATCACCQGPAGDEESRNHS